MGNLHSLSLNLNKSTKSIMDAIVLYVHFNVILKNEQKIRFDCLVQLFDVIK